MSRLADPRFTGTIELPRRTFEHQRWTAPILVVTNPNGQLEQADVDPDPLAQPEPHPVRAPRPTLSPICTNVRPAPETQHQAPPVVAADSVAPRVTGSPPRPLPAPPRRHALPLPRPTANPVPCKHTPPGVPSVRPAQAPAGAATAPQVATVLPTSPPPLYAGNAVATAPATPVVLAQLTSPPPDYAVVTLPRSEAAPLVAAPSLSEDVSRITSAESPVLLQPTSQPAVTRAQAAFVPQELFMVPGGQLLMEAQLPADVIGSQVRCADHPHLRAKDWQHLSEQLSALIGLLTTTQWHAFIVYLAEMPASEHAAAIKHLSSCIRSRHTGKFQADFAQILSVLPQVEGASRGMFALLLSIGLQPLSHMPHYHRTIMQLLAAVWRTALRPIERAEDTAQKTVLATMACGAALRLVMAREQQPVNSPSVAAGCVPLDEAGCARILKIILSKPAAIGTGFVAGQVSAQRLIDLAQRPGPVPAELLEGDAHGWPRRR